MQLIRWDHVHLTPLPKGLASQTVVTAEKPVVLTRKLAIQRLTRQMGPVRWRWESTSPVEHVAVTRCDVIADVRER